MQCDFVVDIGNSNFKVASLQKNKIIQTYRFEHNKLGELIQLIKNTNIVFTNVAGKEYQEIFQENCKIIFVVDNKIKFPFVSEYKTKESWGMDRACNIAAAIEKFPNENVLVVDIGTCIKFDFIDQENSYKGGLISPGIRLRFESLKLSTANLPLLHPCSNYDFIGKSTKESITNGVVYGCYSEILGIINQYESKFKNLKIIITGGDAFYFDFTEKSNIFADDILTLRGLHQLYLFNVE
ncbi:MAG: type III pantothenate kinase [Bacteroidota bacterium]